MSPPQSDTSWQGDLVDAYCHIGDPKYGTLPDVVRFFARLSIEQGVLVLGPGIPDLDSLIWARQHFGDRIRVMGVPFGETEEQRLELGEVQMKIGISGMRLMPFELEPNRPLIDRMGERGLWLFAINPFDAPAGLSGAPSDDAMGTTRFLLDWLERHSSGRVASPHFLRPLRFEDMVEDAGLFRALLQHPRYHAIFSRHGGAHSSQPYPHRDLLPWVEQMAELVTWQRLMWGSEFPIVYQRSEQPEAVRDWLLNLGVRISESEQAGFYANNARRLFFESEAPALEPVEIPAWVEAQIDREQTVYLFPSNQVFIPMEDHGTLLSQYMKTAEAEPDLDYAGYVARLLSEQAAGIRKRGDNA